MVPIDRGVYSVLSFIISARYTAVTDGEAGEPQPSKPSMALALVFGDRATAPKRINLGRWEWD